MRIRSKIIHLIGSNPFKVMSTYLRARTFDRSSTSHVKIQGATFHSRISHLLDKFRGARFIQLGSRHGSRTLRFIYQPSSWQKPEGEVLIATPSIALTPVYNCQLHFGLAFFFSQDEICHPSHRQNPAINIRVETDHGQA